MTFPALYGGSELDNAGHRGSHSPRQRAGVSRAGTGGMERTSPRAAGVTHGFDSARKVGLKGVPRPPEQNSRVGPPIRKFSDLLW